MKKRFAVILIALFLLLLLSIDKSVYADYWGSWSGWQDNYIAESDTIQVETRDVVDSYNMETYVYSDESSISWRGYWPNPTDRTLRAHYTETWAKATLDSARWRISAGNYYDSPDNNNCDGMIHDATAYIVVEGQNHDYVPFFIKGTNYKTQYRYRNLIRTDSASSGNDSSSSGSSTSGNNDTSNNTGSTQENTSGKTTGKSTLSPVSITKIKAFKNKIKVTWKRNKKCTGYILIYSTNSKFKNYKKIIIRKNNTCSTLIQGLKSGKKYYVKVRTYRKIKGKTCLSKWSRAKCIRTKKTTASSTKKSKPKTKKFQKSASVSVTKTKAEKNEIKITWKRNKECNGYIIIYSTNKKFKKCKKIIVRKNSTTFCRIKELKPGKKYYIRIRAFKGSICSKWSNVCKVVTKKQGKKYIVKQKYIKDLGLRFDKINNKYGWTLDDGVFQRISWFNYRVPNSGIGYTFNGHYGVEYDERYMENSSKCIAITGKLNQLVSGVPKKTTVKKFVKRIYSKKKNIKWEMGGQLGNEAIIYLYSSSGKKYELRLFMKNENDRVVRNTTRTELFKADW